MCRWVAYMGEKISLADLLYHSPHSLVKQCLHGHNDISNIDGCGVGWYSNTYNKPALYRELIPAVHDRNLHSMAEHIQAKLFFSHIRASSGTPVSKLNSHPFSYDQWLFMHNGSIGGYKQIRHALECQIQADYHFYRFGSTDSELMFYLLIAELKNNDIISAWRNVVAIIETAMQQHHVEKPLKISAALTDGETIYALHYASNDEPPTLYYDYDDSQPEKIVLASESLQPNSTQWRQIEGNQLIIYQDSQLIKHEFIL